jgi:phosphoglucosamine mutase
MSERAVGEERIFGTDGIRGRAGAGWLEEGRVSALGRAIGAVLGPEDDAHGLPRRALLAHDGRRSGTVLEAALCRGLTAEGFEVLTAGLLTTPGLALLTRTCDFALGIMISASHNEAADNGIKIFSSSGEKLPDDLEDRIEARLRAQLEPTSDGAAPRYDPALERRYTSHLLASAGAGLSLTGLRVAIDCANGAGSRIAPACLRELGAEVICLGGEPDGSNINAGCGSTHPEALQAAVVEAGADLGIALDGDGDRCILVDEQGAIVHGDGILTLLARHAMASRAWPDPRLVATVMSNRGMHRALREVGVDVVTVGVGDRRVVEALRREGLSLGGEQSGHIVFGAENHYIGDGLYTALRVLRVLREEALPLSRLAAPYQPFPQVLLNVPVARKLPLEELPRLAEAVVACEDELGEEGRVLLRYSGTEALARVMVEGPDASRIQTLAKGLAALLLEELGGAA